MFNWLRRIGRYLIITSKTHQQEVERRSDAEREVYELSDKITETENEFEDLSFELEVQREEREYLGERLEEIRVKKNRLEREVTEYKRRKENSIPLQAIRDMIATSQAPALYLTQDLVVLYGNKASIKNFGKRPEGHGLWEFDVGEKEIELLKERARRTIKPFTYELKKSKLHHWMITPVHEEGRILGYILTNQRSFVKDLYRLLRSAIGKGKGIYIPQNNPITSFT